MASGAGGKLRGITVEIGGDTTKLGKALEKAETQSLSLQKELKGVESLLKFDPKNTVLLTQKQELLTKAIAETKEKLDTLKLAQKQALEQFKKGEITEEQYRDLQREIVATEQKLENLTKEVKNFGSVSAQKIAAVGENFKTLGGKIESAGQSLMGVSTGAALALGAVAKGAIDFESAFAGVLKTVNGTEEQLAVIEQGILDLSQSTASSAEEIAAVAEAAGQLGVSTENILSFTETMVRLGDSTNISADEAATAIAQLYNIVGADINTVDQFGATIVALGNSFATTEADIMEMATRLAGAGAQIGLSEAEILGLSASLTSVGISAEAGGTAISTIMSNIDKAVATNSGSLTVWADVARMSVDEFKTLWETDAMGAMETIISGMGDAAAGGENLNLILEDLNIKSIRQTDAMKRLSGASGLLGDAVDLANVAWGENTALINESNKRYETTASKLEQLKGKLTELSVRLGEVLLPVITKIIDAVGKVIDWLTNLSPVAQKIVLVITAITAAAGPVLIAVGKFLSLIGQVMTFAPQIATAFGAIKGALAAVGTALTGPVGIIVAVIAAVIAALVLLYNKCEWFRNAVNIAFAAVKDFIINAFNAVISFFNTTLPAWINSVVMWFQTLPQRVQAAIANLPVGFQLVIQNAQTIWQNFVTIVQNIINILKTTVQAGVEFIKAVFSGNFNQIPGIISNAMGSIGTYIGNILNAALNIAINWIAGIINTFRGLISSIPTIINNLKTIVVNGFNNMKTAVVNKANEIITNVINKFKTLPGKMVTIGKQVIQGLINGVQSMVGALYDSIVSALSGLVDKAKAALGIASPSRVFRDVVGKQIPAGIAVGVEKNAKTAEDAVSNMTEQLAKEDELFNGATIERKLNTTFTAPNATDVMKNDNIALLSKLDNIYERLNRLQIVLDTGTLVGETVDKMDRALSEKQLLSARGV